MPRVTISHYKDKAEEDAFVDLVDSLSDEMKDRFLQKVDEGKEGWDDTSEDNYLYLLQKLRIEVVKPDLDFVDIAVFVVFLWNLKEDFEDES